MTSSSENRAPFEAPRPPLADQAPFAAPPFALRDVLTAVFHDRGAIACAFLLPFLAGIGLSFLVSTTYETQARLLVLLGREHAKPEPGEPAGAGPGFEREQTVKAELEILASRELKAEVIRAIGPGELYPGIGPEADEKAVDRFARNLKLAPVPGSNVIQLAFRHGEPQLAAEALNLLIRFYIDKRHEMLVQPRTPFLKDQHDRFAGRLQDAEKRLVEFRRANAITDIDEQIAALLKQEADQAAQLLQVEERMRGVMAQIEGLKARIADTPAHVLVFNDSARLHTREAARATLLDLESRRRDLLTRYRDGWRTLIDQEIAESRAFLGHEGRHAHDSQRYGRNPVLEDLQREAGRLDPESKGLEARRMELGIGLSRIRAHLQRIGALAQEHRALARDRQLLEENYVAYANRLEEARIGEDLARAKAANIRVIEAAGPPAEGSSPRLAVAAAGGLLGLLAALGTGLALALARRTFLTPEDVERALGLPVLLAVPVRAGPPAGRGWL